MVEAKSSSKEVISNNNNKPIHPYEQLVYVLPKDSIHLLPKKIYNLVNIYLSHNYPDNPQLQWEFCTYIWESHVKLPHISIFIDFTIFTFSFTWFHIFSFVFCFYHIGPPLCLLFAFLLSQSSIARFMPDSANTEQCSLIGGSSRAVAISLSLINFASSIVLPFNISTNIVDDAIAEPQP